MTDPTIHGDELTLGSVRITFERTLRIPEQGLHPLPPGLGAFPLRRVSDYPDTAPPAWLERGGVMLPIHQREAMWLSFDGDDPVALQIGIGKVDAVTGGAWTERLTSEPQNYVALPEQPWLDGINSGDGHVSQFVAVPLGSGATVEGQVTGDEVHGGIQLRAVELTPAARRRHRRVTTRFDDSILKFCIGSPDMGLGAGGRMKQEIYRDERELSDYDETHSSRVFVHLCSAAQWTAITGEVPPPSPVDREAYVAAGLPWFDLYDSDRDDVPASSVLSNVQTVGTVLDVDDAPFTPVDPSTIVPLGDSSSTSVPPGTW